MRLNRICHRIQLSSRVLDLISHKFLLSHLFIEIDRRPCNRSELVTTTCKDLCIVLLYYWISMRSWWCHLWIGYLTSARIFLTCIIELILKMIVEHVPLSFYKWLIDARYTLQRLSFFRYSVLMIFDKEFCRWWLIYLWSHKNLLTENLLQFYWSMPICALCTTKIALQLLFLHTLSFWKKVSV